MNGSPEYQMSEDAQNAKVITLIERKNHQNKIKNDWALRNKDRRKQHTKNYRDKNQEKIKKYRSESRDKALIYSKKWDERNPEKRRARTAVMHAINAGIIKKLTCEKCGNIKVHGHHDNYDKPLEVKWLCAKHHRELHYISSSQTHC